MNKSSSSPCRLAPTHRVGAVPPSCRPGAPIPLCLPCHPTGLALCPPLSPLHWQTAQWRLPPCHSHRPGSPLRSQLQHRGQGQSQGTLCRYPVHSRIKSIDGPSYPRTVLAADWTELHCVCHRVTKSKALWPLGKPSPRKRMAQPLPQATPALSASSIPANLETHCKAWRSEPQDPALGLLTLPIPFASILVRYECFTSQRPHIPILPASSLSSLGGQSPAILLARSPSASLKGQGPLRDELSLASSQHWPCPFYSIPRAPCEALG